MRNVERQSKGSGGGFSDFQDFYLASSKLPHSLSLLTRWSGPQKAGESDDMGHLARLLANVRLLVNGPRQPLNLHFFSFTPSHQM